IEAELIKRIGEPGRKLHTGRSRNDQVALDFMLWIREAAQSECDGWLVALQKAFVVLSDRSREVVMPSFTHMQRAQPICAGAEALAWVTMFSRDKIRMLSCRGQIYWDDSPLGSGAIAGTSLPLESDVLGDDLGFK